MRIASAVAVGPRPPSPAHPPASAPLLFAADNRGWTKPPGQKMDNGSQQFPDKKVLTVVRLPWLHFFMSFVPVTGL